MGFREDADRPFAEGGDLTGEPDGLVLPAPGANPRPDAPDPRRRAEDVGGALPLDALPVFVVPDFGPVAANATPAILDAIAAANLAGGGIIYFPAGEYPIGDSDAGDDRRIHVVDAHCLTFLGDGGCSVLRRDDARPEGGIFLFQACSDIVLADLSLDANRFEPPLGSPQRALAQFELCSRVRIHRVLAKDSHPTEWNLIDPAVLTHRYDTAHHVAFGFYGGQGSDACREVEVVDCELQSLGVAVHGGSQVWIANNDVRAARGHGIAVGARSSGQVHEDIVIVDNLVTDSWAYGIVVADIPPAEELIDSTVMRRVRIEDNRVLKTGNNYKRGIVVGGAAAPEGSERQPDYGSISIVRNIVELHAGADAVGEEGPEITDRVIAAGIWMELPAPVEELDEGRRTTRAFVHARVTDNLVFGAMSSREPGFLIIPFGVGILATNLVQCEIGGNGVFDSDDGIALPGFILGNHIHDNRVEVLETTYRYDKSLGSNHFNSNHVLSHLGSVASARWLGERSLDQFLGGDAPPRRRVVGLWAIPGDPFFGLVR